MTSEPTPAAPDSIPPAEHAEHWTARFARPIVFVIVTLVVLGVYLAYTIPVAVFPTTDFPRIVVGIDNGVAPINQMQVTVTRPVEEAMNSVPGLEEVRSITSRGSAEVNLFFNWNVNMFQTLQYVNAALARVQPSLPPTAKLTANRLTFAAFPILGYSLTSETMPQTALWELANYTIKPRLNRVNGVSMVVMQGGQVPGVSDRARPGQTPRSPGYGAGHSGCRARSNMIDSPGLIENNHELSLALVTGQAHDPGRDRRTSSSKPRPPARARPRRRYRERAPLGDAGLYASSPPTASPPCCSTSSANPTATPSRSPMASARSSIRFARPCRPRVKLAPSTINPSWCAIPSRSVRDAILIGLVLAAIILVLFLRDWGSSLVAGLVIPATIAITLIVLRLLGESFDLMTLGGLAAAVGLVIDDAIVVVENIVLHRDSGQSRGQAIRSALKEIRLPLVGSTITPIVVFLPLITITGVTGVFFRALAVTVGTALFTSLALALTWTPTLSHYLLSRSSGASDRSAERSRRGHHAA